MNINKVHVCGRLTKDPELKALPNGTKVAGFSIATNHSYKTAEGEKKETTEFHNCKAFGKIGELIAQYCRKGGELYIEGRLQTSFWEKDEKKFYKTEIIVDNMQFGAKSPNGGGGEQLASKEHDPIEYPEEVEDLKDVPF